MIPVRVTATELKRLAHFARLHLEFLRQKERQLPITEYTLANRIECALTNEFRVERT